MLPLGGVSGPEHSHAPSAHIPRSKPALCTFWLRAWDRPVPAGDQGSLWVSAVTTQESVSGRISRSPTGQAHGGTGESLQRVTVRREGTGW